ncbi:MAG: hypothetical protein AAGI71_17325 [Bacteroidota bacterium]
MTRTARAIATFLAITNSLVAPMGFIGLEGAFQAVSLGRVLFVAACAWGCYLLLGYWMISLRGTCMTSLLTHWHLSVAFNVVFMAAYAYLGGYGLLLWPSVVLALSLVALRADRRAATGPDGADAAHHHPSYT